MKTEPLNIQIVTHDDIRAAVTIDVAIDGDGSPIWPFIITRPCNRHADTKAFRTYMRKGKSKTSELIRYEEI